MVRIRVSILSNSLTTFTCLCCSIHVRKCMIFLFLWERIKLRPFWLNCSASDLQIVFFETEFYDKACTIKTYFLNKTFKYSPGKLQHLRRKKIEMGYCWNRKWLTFKTQASLNNLCPQYRTRPVCTSEQSDPWKEICIKYRKLCEV